MLLSAYENDSWKDARLNWVEEKQDGAVEVIAVKSDGIEMAIEHTLIPRLARYQSYFRVFLGIGRVVPNPPDCENYDNHCDNKDRDAAPIKAWLAI